MEVRKLQPHKKTFRLFITSRLDGGGAGGSGRLEVGGAGGSQNCPIDMYQLVSNLAP